MDGRLRAKSKTFKSNLARVKKGYAIQFIRNELTISGVVDEVRDNTVIVQLDAQTQRVLDLSTNQTVVNHKNYQIISAILVGGVG